MRSLIICCLVILQSLQSWGQSDSTSNADSIRRTVVLGLDQYLSIVLNNHPVVKQAGLQRDMAQAELLAAKGQFDPKIQSSYDLKNFKEKEYYDLLEVAFKVPTRIPVDPKIQLNQHEGEFLNPQNSIPGSDNYRQVSAGISVPIGKGLLIDERRKVLKQAELYQNYAEAEQVLMVNKILLTAIKDYWEWFLAYKKVELLGRSTDIAQELFNRVKLDYEFGEAAIVDTVQAKITYQTRMAEFEKARFDLVNNRLNLANHLWSESNEPLELQQMAIPDTLATFGNIPGPDKVNEMISWSVENHPKIQQTNLKIQQLLVENRWNKEMLKPQVDVSYSLINAPIAADGEIETPSFSDNYKLGVDFSFPLFLRKERGKIQKTNLKIESEQYALNQVKLQIRNKIVSIVAETNMSNNLAQQYQAMAQNYQRLLDAEVINLQTGESDLFKFNVQQDKYILAQIKYLENLVKFEKNKAEILHAVGLTRLGM